MSLASWPPSTTLPNESLQTTETTNGGCGLLLQVTAASCMTSYVFYLFLSKINSLLCFSLFRIIFCPRGTRQTSCHRLSSHMILMRPCRYPRLSFLQVPLIWTSHLLTLALLYIFLFRCQSRVSSVPCARMRPSRTALSRDGVLHAGHVMCRMCPPASTTSMPLVEAKLET